ncbi:MAG: right-handed parallel beta-helix repeat-containing protein [Labilithrix sp.]|nr:right-handed parallel beta-helix repeat-containing protein [Labilithrix sp.]
MRRQALGSVAVAFILALAARAEAAIVPVSNPTELRAAIAAAKAGDEIVLAAGTYAISGPNLSCSASGTPAQPIVVRSATPLAAKLELSTVEGFLVSGPSWHFEGLDVVGTCATDSTCEHAFHVVGDATGFVLRNSRVVDFNAQLKVNATLVGAPKIPHGGLVENNELFDTRARNTGNPVTKLNIDTGDDWIVRANYIHDFHRLNGTTSYGAFMKSGGKNGLFERNLVLCTKDDATPGSHVGLSFGGGGTGNAFCAPAFDGNVPCAVEHEGGTMRNNVIANCSALGIYINRGKDTKVLHNTLIATSGVDFRYETTTGESRGNVLTGIVRNRDGSTHTAANDLPNIAQATFEAMYTAPLVGDLRKKGDLSALLGKGPANPDVPNDYCARTRGGAWDLGALQHSLGDCTTVPPPPGSGPSPGADAGASSPSGDGGSSGGADAGDGTTNGSGAGGDPAGADEPSGCGCRAARSDDAPTFALVAAAAALALARRRRS